jgi:hypothetical protein
VVYAYKMAAHALLKRFGSTALSLSSVRLRNLFRPRCGRTELQTVLAIRSRGPQLFGK